MKFLETTSLKLGTEPVGKLMFTMATPSVVAMIMQALYSTVDSIFVGRISATSLAAITLAYPITMFSGAMSTGIGVGINSSISRNLGAGTPEKSEKAAVNGMAIGFVSVLIMILFGLFGVRPFLGLYTSDPELIRDGIIYIRTISLLAFGQIFTQISFSILQGSGNMVIPLLSQIAGAISVLILDPLLILVFHMGIQGAGLASSFAQIISMCVGMYGVFVVNRNNLKVRMRGFRPDKEIIKDILSVGIPSMLTQATTSVVSGITNKIISVYGSTAIAVYGGFSKLSNFGILPVFGVTRGMTPILGYSYGAKNRERFIQTRRIALACAFVISWATALFFVLLPNVALDMIGANEEMRAIGMSAYRILGTTLFVSGISIVLAQSFPPAKRSYLTMIYTIVRQAGILVPFCMLFSRSYGLPGVWTGYALTDYAALGVVIVMTYVFQKRVLDKWTETGESR